MARDLAEDAGAAGLIAATIDSVADESTGTRLTVFLAGGFALVVAARTLLKVLAVVHALVWRMPPAKIRRPAHATVSLIVVVGLGLAMVQALSYLRDRSVVPGALLVGVGFQVLHLFTVVWIVRYLENKTEAYGAIGTSLALLLWAFVLGRILTGSAVLNAALWFRRTRQA